MKWESKRDKPISAMLPPSQLQGWRLFPHETTYVGIFKTIFHGLDFSTTQAKLHESRRGFRDSLAYAKSADSRAELEKNAENVRQTQKNAVQKSADSRADLEKSRSKWSPYADTSNETIQWNKRRFWKNRPKWTSIWSQYSMKQETNPMKQRKK